MIKFVIKSSEREAGVAAAEIMAEVIRRPTATIGLATGSTPLNMYAELVEMYRRGDLSFKNVRSVNLDEYVGLSPDHPQSYARFMRDNLFSHVDIPPERCYIPSGTADPLSEC
jgi:glucosamine-6-phosphate deaminase